MIPRYLRVIYWSLIAAIIAMVLLLIFSRRRDHLRILATRDQSSIAAPTDIPNEHASIAMPNDDDDSISLDDISLALPAEPTLRARVLIDRTLTDLSLPASTHPIPAGPAVTDVFFLALPLHNPAASPTDASVDPSEKSEDQSTPESADTQLAVVNFTKTFADAHPSGIESEDLTLRAIIATLHANFPEITQVRFLVDGQARPTLTGHADLTHAYSVSDPTHSIHPVTLSTNN